MLMHGVLSRRPCFCRYGKVILERLIDVLTHGPEPQHTWVLAILQGILEAPHLDLGPDGQLLADPQLTYPVAAFLETDGGRQALQAREASLCCSCFLCIEVRWSHHTMCLRW